MKFNGKLMKQTVTIRNKHLKRIFYRHNLPETTVTSVTNETSEKNGHLPSKQLKQWK